MVMGTLHILELANKWNVRENVKQCNLRAMQSNNFYTVLHARYMSEVLDQFIICQTWSSSKLRSSLVEILIREKAMGWWREFPSVMAAR